MSQPPPKLDIDPGTLLLIVVALLFIPLFIAGFLP